MRFPYPFLVLCTALMCSCSQELPNIAEPLRQGNLVLTVDPATGGRINSLTYHGREMLAQSSALDQMNWGSTLWVSPQSSWDWPPPDSFDTKPFAFEQSADGIALLGPVDKEKTGLRLRKAIHLPGGDRVQLSYALENPSEHPVPAAGWEVTRVPIDGLVVFARAAEPVWWSFGGFAVQEFGDLVWVDAREPLAEGKLNANGRGWLAWVSGRQLFIKRFADLSAADQAPNEAEIQVYVSPRGYMELEAQGAYREIAPGQQLPFTTEWQLVTLPDDVEADVDSPSLQTLLQSLGLQL